MRKIKVLFSMALIAVMLCTVAFASAGVVFTPVEYDGVADTITVELKASEAIVIDSFSSIWMSYDSSIVKYVSATTDAATATVADQTAYSYVEFENSAGDSSVTPDMCLIKAEFNVIDKANIENAVFSIGEGCFASYASGAEILDLTATMTVTKKATEVNPGATAGEKLTGGLTYQTKEGERKFVANNFAISNFDKIGTKKFRVTYTPVYDDATTPVNPKYFDYSINTEELTGTVTFTAALYDIPERVSDVNMSAEFVD